MKGVVVSPVVLGLIAAGCWGVSDWLARGLSKGLGSFRAQLWSQMTGLVVLGAAVVVTGAGVDAVNEGSARAWGFGVVYALLIGFAALSFFEAFGKGALAVVAPIVGGYGAVTVAWGVVFGVVPTPLRLCGLTLVVAGAVLASIPAKGASSSASDASSASGSQRGVLFAVIAAVLFGTAFFVLGKEVAPQLGALVPALLSRAIGPALLVVVAMALGVSRAPPPPGPHRMNALFSGTLASVATVATGLGSHGEGAAVTAVLGSLSVVVTVIIGLFLLKERLAPHQWVGTALALVGIPLLV